MRNLQFLEPQSIQEACHMLAEHGEDCRVIAGGTALILALRQRMLNPTHLVSLGLLSALRQIRLDPLHGLCIGALALHADVARSPLVRQHAPMLADMAGRLANPQVRNQGTLGGNLCYADPATDPPSCLLALEAHVVLHGRAGERVLPIADFLVDYFTTALAADELLIEIRIAHMAAGTMGVYRRFLRTAAEHRPLVNVAFTAQLAQGLCQQPRLAIGAATPVAHRNHRAEAFLAGKPISHELAIQTADIVAQDASPISDQRGSGDYRRDMLRVLTQRSLMAAFGLPTPE